MIRFVLEQPVASIDELADDAGRFRGSVGPGGRDAESILDLGGQAGSQLRVQRANQSADAILFHLGGMGHFTAGGRGDRAANAVTLENPVEASRGMDALVEGDVDQRLHVLVGIGLVRFQGGANGLRLVDHAEERPRLRQAALLEKQASDLAGRLPDGVLIGGVQGVGDVGSGTGRDRGDAQFQPLLHQQAVEKRVIFAPAAELLAQPLDGGAGPSSRRAA